MTISTALQQVANRLAVSENELQNIVLNTVFPANKKPTTDQFLAFMAVANEYHLNPLTKEIYAFPTQGGGIQPIVSIDGWLKIINTNKDFNGMTFEDIREEGKLIAITCSIYKKDILHPVQVTEYLAECAMGTQPWKKYPSRMLRHKAAIQCGRYAFGLSGIIDTDEADRYAENGVIDMGDANVIDGNQVNEKDEKLLALDEWIKNQTDNYDKLKNKDAMIGVVNNHVEKVIESCKKLGVEPNEYVKKFRDAELKQSQAIDKAIADHQAKQQN